jgi:hypothetical protein
MKGDCTLPYRTKIIFFKKDDRPGFPTGSIFFFTRTRGGTMELENLYKDSMPGRKKCIWKWAYVYDNRTGKPCEQISLSNSMSFLYR